MVDQHVISLIKELKPTYYFIENPRGVLVHHYLVTAQFSSPVNIRILSLISYSKPRGGMRKMSWMQELPRYTVTYCQYGDERISHNADGILLRSILPFNPCVPVLAPLGADT